MNIEALEGTDILHLQYNGPLTEPELVHVKKYKAQQQHSHGGTSLLLDYGQARAFDSRPSLWAWQIEEAGMLDHVRRIAVMAEGESLHEALELIGALAPTHVRGFDATDRDAALDWLNPRKADPPSRASTGRKTRQRSS